ncbi:hypothetical protein ABID21_001933 [Pseudorhizobium tarimense]|uniref:Transposase n=1 Tax=Pseudorhizobium tarimense TaxID=1079109 RepID=A0ABV2H5J1_9HYPH|nr:hypothetical protein [Pseudorhizobium tarimense]MCJ8519025.1 hypothetical protein [Pseudorhizobium tarimense]
MTEIDQATELKNPAPAPETEAEPQPEPKYNPEFKKAVVAVVLEMKRKRVI